MIVVLRRGRVLLVEQPGERAFTLPGGVIDAAQSLPAAAARLLAEQVGVAGAVEDFHELGELESSGATKVLPTVLVRGSARRNAPATMVSRWVALEHLGRRRVMSGVAVSVHAAQRAMGTEDVAAREALLAWWEGEREHSDFPWRATRDPYAILVCEVMSQQTQIDRVRGYWDRWMARWPTAASLAAASLADVLGMWQGLGYPRRARDLHASAQVIASCGWPAPEGLEDLPGVGPYTAAAVRCFAFEEPVMPLDANVRRVLERRFPAGLSAGWAEAQAAMDLGRRHCRARPGCDACPLSTGCLVASADGGWDPAHRVRRQSPFRGSLRQRRGLLLRAALEGARPSFESSAQAAASLVADRLVILRDGVLLAPER